jgi:hypothetical protein
MALPCSARFRVRYDWSGKVLSKRRLCHRLDEHSRRVVLVSAKPIAGRAWKSLTRDECIETRKLLVHWLALQQLCGSLNAASLHTNLLRVRGH